MKSVVAIVGLGYVGLPLAVAFGRLVDTIGYDLDDCKLAHYRCGCDPTGEVTSDALRAATQLRLSSDPAELAGADFILVTVPTPVDDAHRPDLTPLMAASETVGRFMKPGATIIYESTVYPGATEEVCIPVLESASGLRWKRDFQVGYSPERINPGDKEHGLANTVKVVAGDSAQTLEQVARLYEQVVTAGVHRASSIAVAEAANVIENTKRDINIALMNELALIFARAGIDTLEVLEAAGTKLNFLPFRPGLVGGHCIGVDPYYLAHKAERLGHHPEVILAGRRINDSMAGFVAAQTVKQMIQAGLPVKGGRVLVLGLTFKENCPDIRNSKVADIVRELADYGCAVSVHDPLADAAAARHEYGIDLCAWEALAGPFDAVVAAVAHRHYLALSFAEITARLKPGAVFADVKSAFDTAAIRAAGLRLWRL